MADFLEKILPRRFKKSRSFRTFLAYFLIFVLFFAIFYSAQFSFSYFGCPDSYYHIKQSWLIRNEGFERPVKNFPWLQCTILKDRPADGWFGYHLLLLPFTFGNLIYGMKLSGVFFSTLLFLAAFWVFRKFRIKYAFFWTIFLFVVSPTFSTRLILARPFILSTLLSLLSVLFIVRKNYLWLFIVSIGWTLISVEAPLVIALAFSWVFLEWLLERKIDLKMLLMPVLGMLAGLLIRPDFPNNAYFLFYQSVSVLWLRFRRVPLDFGAELAIPFQVEPTKNLLLLLSLSIPLAWAIIKVIDRKWREIPVLFWYLLSWTIVWIILTTGFSTRFVEYWVPFTVLLFGIYFNSVFFPKFGRFIEAIKNDIFYELPFSRQKIRKIYQSIYKLLKKVVNLPKIGIIRQYVLFFFLFFTAYLMMHQLNLISGPQYSITSYEYNLYRDAANWLKENTAAGDIVLNRPWSSFTYLFFFNDKNYYCSGMDPTFMYLKSPRFYWFWLNITRYGIACGQRLCSSADEEHSKVTAEDIYEVLGGEMRGNYMYLDGNGGCSSTDPATVFKRFSNITEGSPHFQKVFDKSNLMIYKIQ